MKAKNREQYVEAWKNHAREFIHVFMDADKPMDEYLQFRAEMDRLIELAAEATYGNALKEG